jgi:restriction system protein
MQHEGAILGIMITTSGCVRCPGSEEFANGKPLHLIDGPGLISICQEHGIPGLGTRRHRPPISGGTGPS